MNYLGAEEDIMEKETNCIIKINKSKLSTPEFNSEIKANLLIFYIAVQNYLL